MWVEGSSKAKKIIQKLDVRVGARLEHVAGDQTPGAVPEGWVIAPELDTPSDRKHPSAHSQHGY